MNTLVLILIVLALSSLFYFVAKRRSLRIAAGVGGIRQLHSAPRYYGIVAALLFSIPALTVLGLWVTIDESIIVRIVLAEHFPELNRETAVNADLITSQIQIISQSGRLGGGEITPALQAAVERYQHLTGLSKTLRNAAVLALGSIAGFVFILSISAKLRARPIAESIVRGLLLFSSLIAIFTTVGIVLSVLFEAINFFRKIPVMDFLFGLEWSPQIAIREDQVGSSGLFGSVPLFTGTILIAAVAMAVAVPIGLLSAIYLAEYASVKVRAIAKPTLEILAGVPTVVYGFFAALIVAPYLANLGAGFGIEIAHESALAAGVVMGIMIIPFVSSLSDDVITAVPQSIREASLACGATRSETIKRAVLPAALHGIVGALLLAISRAIGETMIVLMAAGLAAKLTANPLESVTTVTVQIVTLLVGDQEFDNPKTLAAFALGLTLFIATLMLNVTALYIARKYSEQYE